MTRAVDTIVVGAGQAGLATARCLHERGIGHVVLERGRIGEAWRSRWDSLRLLTPNWMTRLPGYRYEGPEPDGFMNRDELVAFFEGYVRRSGLTVREGVTVRTAHRDGGRFEVETDGEHLHSENLVVATGHAAVAAVPTIMSELLDPSIHQLHSSQYRNPEALTAGGVLIVGAGASGLQLAAELRRHGRKVVVAVGRHARAVRRYRGRDLWWWLDRIGSLDVTADEVADLEAARRAPSLGLTGAGGGIDIDLGTLARDGVETVGRVLDISGTRVELGANLENDVADADRRLSRLLDRFDVFAEAGGVDARLPPSCRPPALRVSSQPVRLDLAASGITNVIWCTGFRRAYDWLDVPVLDGAGEVIHRRGVTPVPGLYVMGQRFQWRRGSHFIDGVGHDARHVVASIERRSASEAA
jgi:putative flavoprotein involved in K+ transport